MLLINLILQLNNGLNATIMYRENDLKAFKKHNNLPKCCLSPNLGQVSLSISKSESISLLRSVNKSLFVLNCSFSSTATRFLITIPNNSHVQAENSLNAANIAQ